MVNALAGQGASRSNLLLRRVLYVAALDPGVKFGSLEEQILRLARSFRERGAKFVPVFVSPLRGRTRAAYAAEGLDAECLDLNATGSVHSAGSFP